LQAQNGHGLSNELTLNIAPHLHRLSASKARSGTRLTLKGCGFGPSKSEAQGTVRFSTKIARVLSWSNKAIVVRVPRGPAGAVKVKVATLGGISNVLRLRRL
jgi:hypothetical protein